MLPLARSAQQKHQRRYQMSSRLICMLLNLINLLLDYRVFCRYALLILNILNIKTHKDSYIYFILNTCQFSIVISYSTVGFIIVYIYSGQTKIFD